MENGELKWVAQSVPEKVCVPSGRADRRPLSVRLMGVCSFAKWGICARCAEAANPLCPLIIFFIF